MRNVKLVMVKACCLILILTLFGYVFSANSIQREDLLIIGAENATQLSLLASIDNVDSEQNPIHQIVFDPASTLVAYRKSDEFGLWDVSSGKIRWRIPISEGYGVAFSPLGNMVAVAGNQSVILWNDLSHSESWQQLMWEDFRTSNPVYSVQFSNDGTEVVGVILPDYGIGRWNTSTAELLLQVFHDEETEYTFIIDTLLSHDAHIAALVRAQDKVEFVDTITGELLSTISAWRTPNISSPGPLRISLLTFTPDASAVIGAITGTGITFPILATFRVEPAEIIPTEATIPDLETGLQLSPWLSGSFTPDGRYLVLAYYRDNSLRFFDAETLSPVASFPTNHERLRTFAISPDGKRIVTGSSDGTLKLWGIPAE